MDSEYSVKLAGILSTTRSKILRLQLFEKANNGSDVESGGNDGAAGAGINGGVNGVGADVCGGDVEAGVGADVDGGDESKMSESAGSLQ